MFGIHKKHKNAFVMASIATMLLGTNAAALKIASASMDPLLYSGLRLLGAGLILLFFVKNFRFLRDWKVVMQLALSGSLILIFISTYSLGVAQSGAFKASVLGLIIPIVVYALSVSLLREPFIKRVIAGVAVALTGSILLVGAPVVLGQAFVFGDVLLLIGYTAVAAALVHAKYMYRWVGPQEVLSIRFVFAGALLLLFLWVFMQPATGDFIAWSVLVYGIFITGVVANMLYYRALTKIRAEDAAPIFYLDPMTGSLAAALLLGERLETGALIGVGVIIFGVWLAHPHHHYTFHQHHIQAHHPLRRLKQTLKHGVARVKH